MWLRGKESGEWCGKIWELMDAVDDYIPLPVRDIDRPFLMSIEDVFGIKGRGTVVTGRVERGVIKPGEDVEIIGFGDVKKSVATGLEMFHKTLDSSEAGDAVGVLLRGIEPRRYRERAGAGKTWHNAASRQSRGPSVMSSAWKKVAAIPRSLTAISLSSTYVLPT